MAVVGRVARPHGLRGQFVVDLETDFPQERFRPGAELFVRRAGIAEPVTIATVRFQRGRPIVGLVGVESVEAVSPLVGGELRVPIGSLARLPPGTFYRHDLVGCRVETGSGDVVGVVSEVEGEAAWSCLVIETPKGSVLVPLAAGICSAIDPAGKRIVIDPPEGLLDLNVRP
jgi:16S rRNA processing protein RimM